MYICCSVHTTIRWWKFFWISLLHSLLWRGDCLNSYRMCPISKKSRITFNILLTASSQKIRWGAPESISAISYKFNTSEKKAKCSMVCNRFIYRTILSSSPQSFSYTAFLRAGYPSHSLTQPSDHLLTPLQPRKILGKSAKPEKGVVRQYQLSAVQQKHTK